jgi:hypothetical protein
VPTQATARKNAADRFQENTDELSGLRKQYTSYESQQADAYAEQKRLIDQATQRLMGLPTGPSDQEMMYRIGAAGATPNHNGIDIAGVNAAKAQGMAETRQGQMQRAQLLADYGMRGPDAEIAQTNALMSKNLAEQRVAQSGANSAGGQQFRGAANMPWYVRANPDGTYALQPGADRIMDQVELTKMFGKFTLLPQPDGSKKIVPLGATAATQTPNLPPPPKPAAPQSPPGGSAAAPPTQAPGAAPPPAGPPPVRPGVPPNAGAPQQPPQVPQKPPAKPDPLMAQYSDLFLPSTVLDPKYGALTPQTKPAYVATAAEAFDPQYFNGYTWKPTHMGDDKVRVKQIEAGSQAMGDAAQGAESTIYNYGQALSNMDKLSDPKLLTGPAGAKIGAFENFSRGVLGDDLTSKIASDPQLKSLATQQDTDKYFLQAATTGLKAIYGGRITNMEVQQRLKSLPSSNLMPAVARLLASAQAEVAQDQVNKSKLWSAYIQKNGNPDPSVFNTWYEANFSPFHQSRLKDNLTAQEAATVGRQAHPNTPSVVTQDPYVDYYMKLGAWTKGDQKGPKPVMPPALQQKVQNTQNAGPQPQILPGPQPQQ